MRILREIERQRERQRERQTDRQTEREEREREREIVCVCVCVCVRERENFAIISAVTTDLSSVYIMYMYMTSRTNSRHSLINDIPFYQG